VESIQCFPYGRLLAGIFQTKHAVTSSALVLAHLACNIPLSAAESYSAPALEEIIVTAQKREQSLQDTPNFFFENALPVNASIAISRLVTPFVVRGQ
jgi:hypothetical protein